MKLFTCFLTSLLYFSNVYAENRGATTSDSHDIERYILCDVNIEEWPAVEKAGVYQPDSIQKEGFIHCAKPSQYPHVMQKYFNGETRVIFVINPERLSSPLKYEGSDPTNLYPHIYGPLPLSEVNEKIIISPRPDGSYELPDCLKSNSKVK